MFIRFASAASAVALAACLATPAFASEADASVAGPALETPTDTLTTQDMPVAVRAVAPVDLATATGQDEATPAFTVSGAATLTSDYRFRGISQSDEGMAVQGGVTISHESGFYVGAWGSNLAGWAPLAGPIWNLT